MNKKARAFKNLNLVICLIIKNNIYIYTVYLRIYIFILFYFNYFIYFTVGSMIRAMHS